MNKVIRLSGYRVNRIISGFLFFAFCCLLSVLPSFAMDVPRFYGEEVVVTASRLPQLKSSIPWSVSVITSDDLKLKGAKYLSDALEGEIGTDIISYGYLGSLSSVRLRGSSSQQVLVLIDGKRVNSPLNGGVDLSNYPVDEIDKIEVVRTPLSAVYGADAVGGVVNIITKKVRGNEKGVSVSFGSLNEQKIRLSYNYSDEKLHAYINAGQNKVDASRPNSQFSESDYNLKASKPLTDTTNIELEYSNFSADKRIPGSISFPSLNASQEDRNNILSLSFLSSPGSNSSYIAKIYQRGENSRYKDPDMFTDSPYQAIVSGIEIEKRENNLSVGLEARQDAADGSAISGYKATRNLAVYAEDILGPLTLGLRADSHSTFGTILTPRAGIVHQLKENASVSLSYSGAFRAPVLNELYGNYPPYFPGGLPYLGNPNLKPEKGYLIEASVALIKMARLTVFSGKTSDLITSSWPINMSSTAYTPVNLNSTTRQGVEIEHKCEINPLLKSSFNYTYQNCFDDSTGARLVYLPENKANINIYFGNNIGGGNIMFRFVGERPYVDYPPPTYIATRAILPDFLTVDVRLSRKIWGAEVLFGVENLYNKNYQLIADYPQPGRRFSFGVKYGI